LFLVSDASFFLALLSSRYFVEGLHTPEHVNQALGLFLTVLLLVSSLTAYRAETAAANGNTSRYRWNMFLTMLIGVVFIFGVAFEWIEAFKHFPPSTGYGTVLFTLTGVHATHVLSGVIVLAIVYRRGLKKPYTPDAYWGVEGAVKYWHFVDVAWVFIYPTLYLVK
jgi:cytochrome c oxidase subunit 3